METQVRTPQMVFMQPQRLVVPLFQRPYVWNEENQWEPLWGDLVRLAERRLRAPGQKHHPHFLGAVVLQQVQKSTGLMQERTIIDGQQRLTTLQLLLDALHAELVAVDSIQPAARIEPLIANAPPFCSHPEDRFKVWPTNKDRPAFNAVMAAPPPIDYTGFGQLAGRMVQAHRFFGEQAREWLRGESPHSTTDRAAAIETVVREDLQIVVIDLAVDEHAQEIFETLNARGAQLTAADLIKNFVFQKLLEAGADVEATYDKHWKDFETGFWETEISVGRVRYPRSSIFLNHWLVARTGEEVVAREVFERFKRYADHDAHVPMAKLLERIHDAAVRYREFVTDASKGTGLIDRLGLFGYRTGTLESEAIKPLVLCLLDPSETKIPNDQLAKALDVVESWMVRRMLVRATTKAYNQAVAELVALLRASDRNRAGDIIEQNLAGQKSESRYWPDDEEVREQIAMLLAYKRLGRGRLRMVLEAIEDHRRGWRAERSGTAEDRVPRGKLAIEHVMPRKWSDHWPLNGDISDERDRIIHTFGNLTLLTGKLNSKVSNAKWSGAGGKRDGLEANSVLLLTRDLLTKAGDNWTTDGIRARTGELTDAILQIWPVPPGHRSNFAALKPRKRKKVSVLDLIAAGKLEPGMTLYPRSKKFATKIATLLPDGRVEVDGRALESPSAAAVAIVGHAMNGWGFFLTDQASRRSLRMVRRDYVNEMAVDVEDDDDADGDGDDDDHDGE